MFPSLTREIANAGHEIGNHGYKHYHVYNLSYNEIIDMIKKNEELLKTQVTAVAPLFAPPYGEVNDFIIKAAQDIGYETIMWTVDTIDWQNPSPEKIKERVLNNVVPGAIILMHPVQSTAQALPYVIKGLKARGYEIVPVSDILPE